MKKLILFTFLVPCISFASTKPSDNVKIYAKPVYQDKGQFAAQSNQPSTLDKIDSAMHDLEISTPDADKMSKAIDESDKEDSATIIRNGKICRAVKLIIEKSERKMSLYYGNELQRTYKVRLGFNPIGAKEKRNDGKTPEGTYNVAYKNAKSQFYKSFAVSYPNTEDLARARSLGLDPGGDIMIHGLQNRPTLNERWDHYRGKDWTAGCIAIDNEAMDELWKVVDTGAFIEIKP